MITHTTTDIWTPELRQELQRLVSKRGDYIDRLHTELRELEAENARLMAERYGAP